MEHEKVNPVTLKKLWRSSGHKGGRSFNRAILKVFKGLSTYNTSSNTATHIAEDCSQSKVQNGSKQKFRGKGGQNLNTCHNCGGRGHYARQCPSEKANKAQQYVI